MPNNDPGSSFIREKLLKEKNEKNLIFENFDRLDFLTIMKNSIAIIGNSSSGIIEAPSFKLPTVNIGRRQNKRFRAKNVIDVKDFNKGKILKAIKLANSENFKKSLSKVINPYGNGRSSAKIVDELIKMNKNESLLTKTLTY